MSGNLRRRFARPRLSRRDYIDAAIALALTAFALVGTFFAGHGQPEKRDLDLLGFVLVALAVSSTALRRRYPEAVLLFAFAITLTYSMLDYPRGPVFLGLILAFITAVTHGRRVFAWVILGVGYVCFLWLPPLLLDDPAPTTAPIVGLAAWLLVLATVGEIIRVRRERVAESARSREQEALRLISEERVRIARELHDVIAHNVSMINVQAGVALHLIDEQPEQARTALAAIKDASKDALSEMRSLIGALRPEDEASPRSPAPSLSRLSELVSRTEAAGVTVRTAIEGTPRPLAAGVDLAAYRIIQEALTNVVRHAGLASVTITVTYGEDALTVQVDDNGRGPASTSSRPKWRDLGSGGRPASTSQADPARKPPHPRLPPTPWAPEARNEGNFPPSPAGRELEGGHGAGIIGMRERAAALGGDLETGERPGGGFRVRARLPLDGPR